MEQIVDTASMHGAPRWHAHFSVEEIRQLREVSDVRGAVSLVWNYLLIAAAMAWVVWWPHVVSVVIALWVIGARQLGLAVITHEAAHRTLFTNRWLNDFVGNWLAAYPIYLSVPMYREHHIAHHTKTWTDQDPDLSLATGFPVSKASMTRKVLRDLVGLTGLKQVLGTTYLVAKTIAGHDVDVGALPLRLEPRAAAQMCVGTVVTNAVLFLILWALGVPWLIGLWLAAYLTTNKLVTRIRSIAEHAMAGDTSNPFQNARTVQANWLERLFLSPNLVYFHIEHHLLMTVPHYRLPRFHKMLRDRGLLEDANIAPSYLDVMRKAVA